MTILQELNKSYLCVC